MPVQGPLFWSKHIFFWKSWKPLTSGNESSSKFCLQETTSKTHKLTTFSCVTCRDVWSTWIDWSWKKGCFAPLPCTVYLVTTCGWENNLLLPIKGDTAPEVQNNIGSHWWKYPCIFCILIVFFCIPLYYSVFHMYPSVFYCISALVFWSEPKS